MTTAWVGRERLTAESLGYARSVSVDEGVSRFTVNPELMGQLVRPDCAVDSVGKYCYTANSNKHTVYRPCFLVSLEVNVCSMLRSERSPMRW